MILKSNKSLASHLGLPEDWKVFELEALGAFSKGKGIAKSEVTDTGLPCVRYGELYTSHDYVVNEYVSFINENSASNSKRVEKGDILFAGSGETIEEIGKSAAIIKDEVAYAGGDIIILKTNGQSDSICLSYALETDYVRKQKRRLGQGNSVVHIYSKDLSTLLVGLPPLPEQHAIAKVLGSMDKAINTNNQLVAQKELRKKWLMQNLLTGKKRLKGFSGEWREYKYGDILKEVKRKIEWGENELYKLISVRRRSGGIFYRDALYGHQIKVKNLRNVETGDYLISKMQILHGASALVTSEFEDAKISGSYIAVVAKDPSVLNMEYFNWLSKLKYFYYQTYISSYGVHIEKMTFDFKSFLGLECQLPTLEEQTAIVQILQAADREHDLLRAKTEKLKEQKKWMMQVLLTGKKRLKI